MLLIALLLLLMLPGADAKSKDDGMCYKKTQTTASAPATPLIGELLTYAEGSPQPEARARHLHGCTVGEGFSTPSAWLRERDKQGSMGEGIVPLRQEVVVSIDYILGVADCRLKTRFASIACTFQRERSRKKQPLCTARVRFCFSACASASAIVN